MIGGKGCINGKAFFCFRVCMQVGKGKRFSVSGKGKAERGKPFFPSAFLFAFSAALLSVFCSADQPEKGIPLYCSAFIRWIL